MKAMHEEDPNEGLVKVRVPSWALREILGSTRRRSGPNRSAGLATRSGTCPSSRTTSTCVRS
jgi:hypothetical protein